MAMGLKDIPDEEAVRGGEASLDHLGLVSAPPQGASDTALRASSQLEGVANDARAVQAQLAAAVVSVETLLAQHAQQLADAKAEEKVVDASFAALRGVLQVAIKNGSAYAKILDAFLFPGGSSPVSNPRLRAQVGKYQAWLLRADDPAARNNPEYGLIAAPVEDFRARSAAFAATIKKKEDLAAALPAARTARGQARGAWNATFSELIDTVARIHGEDSDAFRAWLKPLQDIKAAQKAASTRRAGSGETPPDTDG